MNYKEIPMKEALNRYADGYYVLYRYFTNGAYSWIGGISLDHLRRNPGRYKFFVVVPKKPLYEKELCRSELKEGTYYHVTDVKEHLNNFIGTISESKSHREEILEDARAEFGKELVDYE